jgi:two-component system LytT family response regulator
MKLTAMIIDDEPFVRDDLRYMLNKDPEVEVIAEAVQVAEARELLKQKHPDLLFLDVELRGGSGFDLLPDITEDTHVVFITAHQKHARRAHEVPLADCLLKPIASEELAVILQKQKRVITSGR